ncbi:MAG: hypothetical protein Q9197_003251 [Variospora fuerteventurae]
MDPCDQLQKLGQGAYRRKNYPAALDFFNSVSGGVVTTSMAQLRLLRRMHEDMIRSYGTGRAKDPLTVLPAEIAEMILSYLDFRQIISHPRLGEMARVSMFHAKSVEKPGLLSRESKHSAVGYPEVSRFLTGKHNPGGHKPIHEPRREILSSHLQSLQKIGDASD